jgi:hypothetical protein
MFIAALFTIAKPREQLRFLLPINGLRKCGIYTEWNFIQPQKELNFVIYKQMDGT